MSGTLPITHVERFAIHDGPGIRTAVFLQGCPLRCPWCANPENQTACKKLMYIKSKCVGCGRCAEICPQKDISLQNGKAFPSRVHCVLCGRCAETCPSRALHIKGELWETNALFQLIMRDADYYAATGGGVTFSGGEALLYAKELKPLLRLCSENAISVAFETCGQVSPFLLQEVLSYTAVFLFDLKTLNEKKLKNVIGGDLQVILYNFRTLTRENAQKITARIPVIPGFNDTEEEMSPLLHLCADEHVKNVHLLPYHTLGVHKYEQLGLEYPYPVHASLSPENLRKYAVYGEHLGLNIQIGG